MSLKSVKKILLVEDSPEDILRTREAFNDINKAAELHVASDGLDAMAYLHQEGVHADAPRPDIILMALNLPKMDGRELLAQIKGDERLKAIPTIILTTSEAQADILKSYQLKANTYFSKPTQFDSFLSLIKSINDFWLVKAKLSRQGY
jgi:two-component system, chemotaxis family, response regulator Rcp1